MSIQFSTNLLRYEDVRQQIVNYLQDNSEFSSTFDWTASNISYIIDTMSYVTMLMSYQITNVSNNNFLDTTNLRKNAVSISKNMGYKPKRVISSMINGTLSYYDPNQIFTTDSYLTILSKSLFISNSGYTFINNEPITLTLSNSNPNILTGTYTINEGIAKEFTAFGTGMSYQTFLIPSTKVEENSLELYVKKTTGDDNTKVKWTEVKNAFNIVDSNIYFVEEDIVTEGVPKIKFGDGIIGNYPMNDETIIVKYTESNGSLSNGQYITSIPKDLNSFSKSDDFTLNIQNFIDVVDETNISYGGKDLETLEEIKESAPRVYASAGRAVTKNDFSTILDSYSYIFKGNAIGGEELFPGDSTKLGNIYLSAVPYINFSNFLENQQIYLTTTQEALLKYEIKKYNVLSTKIDFFKPSYIYIELTPEVEFKNNISVYDEVYTKEQIVSNLNSYSENNFREFGTSFRGSKLVSEIDKLSNVVSSNISSKYYFILNKDTLYDTNNAINNYIYLPVQIKTVDSFSNPTSYSSLVQTNLEYSTLYNIPTSGSFNIDKRTIYGQIYHPFVDRWIYNEDTVIDGKANTALIKLYGKNKFFELYRFEPNYDNNFIPLDKIKTFFNGTEEISLDIVISNATSGSYIYDNYSFSYNGTEIGSVVRTYNRDYFKGLVSFESDIYETPTTGIFHEVIDTIAVSGSNMNFTQLEPNEYIIYNESLSGGMWTKTIFKEEISAVTDSGLYTVNEHNDIYLTEGTGDFEGYLTESVSAGDYIIFNINSESNPIHKWEKLNRKYPALDCSMTIPPKAIDYDIKVVEGLGLASTNFGGRTSATFYDDDLIFYNASATAEQDKWVKLVNVSDTDEMEALLEVTAASGSDLEMIDYHPASGAQIGDLRRVKDIGSFTGSEERIIWPVSNELDHIAYVNDVLVYVGEGQWRIFSRSFASLYSIDGTEYSSIPIDLEYGYLFTVAGSGTFDNSLIIDFLDGDEIVYTDLGWIKLSYIDSLDSSLSSNLPVVANIGDVVFINEDGDFLGSTLVYPLNQQFVDGDYIIFTGQYWVQLREYSFLPTQLSNEETGKDLLNDMGFNSKFYYEYDIDTKFYKFYFDDIYSGITIGTFRYDINDDELDSSSRYDVGKIKFDSFVQGKLESVTTTELTPLKELLNFYDSAHKNDIIQILPKNKKDINDLLLLETEEDFDGLFNQMTVISVKEIVKK